MSVSKLPDIGTQEWDICVDSYTNRDTFDYLVTLYGYSYKRDFVRAMRLRGIVREDTEVINGFTKPPSLDKVEINLPVINLKSYEPSRYGEGDEEVQILHATDGHAGEITPSFDPDIYKKRMENMFQSALDITTLHRKMYPIQDLVILNTGDNVHGENPHQGARIGRIAMGARDQVTKLAFPTWLETILSFREHFKSVKYRDNPHELIE